MEDRLKSVPTEQLEDSLLALADLRRKYSNQKQTTKFAADDQDSDKAGCQCPLCNFDFDWCHRKGKKNDDCSECLWVWFTDMTCRAGDWESDPIGTRLLRIDLWEGGIRYELTLRNQGAD